MAYSLVWTSLNNLLFRIWTLLSKCLCCSDSDRYTSPFLSFKRMSNLSFSASLSNKSLNCFETLAAYSFNVPSLSIFFTLFPLRKSAEPLLFSQKFKDQLLLVQWKKNIYIWWQSKARCCLLYECNMRRRRNYIKCQHVILSTVGHLISKQHLVTMIC